MKQAGQYYWYHNDHLGTPQKLSTSSGAVVWSAIYSSFLEATIDASSTIINNLRAPGQYFDAETGFHYNYHRHYDPKLGRYLQIDPIGIAGGINPYLYANGNTLTYIDNLGLKFKDPRSNIYFRLLKLIHKIAKAPDEDDVNEFFEEMREPLYKQREIVRELEQSARRQLKACNDDCITKYSNNECQRLKCHLDICLKNYREYLIDVVSPARETMYELEIRLKPYKRKH